MIQDEYGGEGNRAKHGGRGRAAGSALSAKLYFSHTLRNDDWGRAVAFHEARHAYYAAFLTHAPRRDLIDRDVPARVRRHVNRQLDDMIETLIGMDTLQFRGLTNL